MIQAWLAVQVALGVALGLERLLPARPAGEQQRRARLLVALAVGAPLAGVVLARFVSLPRLPAPPVGEALSPFVPAQVWGGLATPAVEAWTAAGQALPGAAPMLLPVVLLVGGAGLAWLGLGVGRVGRALAGAVPVRAVGAVRVVVSARVAIPFAVRTPARAVVVLDPETFADARLRDVAVRHELGHHRRGDPAWALGVALLRAVCWPNPAVHLWSRRLAALDEHACDAAVAPRIGALSYAEALVAVAARMVRPPRAALVPPLFPTLLPAVHRSLLARRIHMLLSPPRPAPPLLSRLALAGSAVVLLALAPLALAPPAVASPERPAPGPAATGTAATADAFPLEASAPVLAALARMRDDEKRAGWVRRAISARPAWSALVDGALRDAGLPPELAAVPLVESGYTNWGAPGAVSYGSMAPGIPGRGLWMFIPETAREYGLRVDALVDERLDPVRETEAAVALLADLHDTFGDWRLALAGYNQGASLVNRAIAGQGTRDPWALVEAGALNDYVPQVVAVALVLRDPGLLDR